MVRALTSGLLVVVGIGAAAIAAFNLVGVPMMEARLMNPLVGWISVGVALLCLFALFWKSAAKR